MAISSKQLDAVMKQMAFWLCRWYNNPLAYVIECIGDTPTHHQAQILKDVVEHGFVAVRSGHGIGKTRLMAWLCHWWLDTHKVPGAACRIPCTGASEDALKNNLWAEMKVVNDKKPKFFSKRYFIGTDKVYNREDRNAWFAEIRVARPENPDALQGFHNCLFMIDEGSGVDDAIFEVARGAMGDPGNMGVMFGNPTKTVGYFYKAFKGRFWHSLHFSSEDSLADVEYSYKFVDALGNIHTIVTKGRQTRKWIQSMKDDFGEDSNVYKIRVRGEFADASVTNLVIEPEWMGRIFEIPERDVMRKRPLVMGVDIAREGEDDSAVVIRQGTEVLFCTSWHGNDLFISRKKIQLIQDEWHCEKIYIDIIGMGAGVHDEMRARSYPVNGVKVSESAPDTSKECRTMRDHLWWQSRKFCRQHNVRFARKNQDFERLQNELTVVSYKVHEKNGFIQIETKEELKKRGYKSPNYADAFNMTMLYDADIKDVSALTKKGYDKIQKYLQKAQGKKSYLVA